MNSDIMHAMEMQDDTYIRLNTLVGQIGDPFEMMNLCAAVLVALDDFEASRALTEDVQAKIDAEYERVMA